MLMNNKPVKWYSASDEVQMNILVQMGYPRIMNIFSTYKSGSIMYNNEIFKRLLQKDFPTLHDDRITDSKTLYIEVYDYLKNATETLFLDLNINDNTNQMIEILKSCDDCVSFYNSVTDQLKDNYGITTVYNVIENYITDVSKYLKLTDESCIIRCSNVNCGSYNIECHNVCSANKYNRCVNCNHKYS